MTNFKLSDSNRNWQHVYYDERVPHRTGDYISSHPLKGWICHVAYTEPDWAEICESTMLRRQREYVTIMRGGASLVVQNF